MKLFFTQTIDGIEHEFERVDYGEAITYLVSFEMDNNITQIRMKLDIDNDKPMWKIQAQALPLEIHQRELKLNDAIEEYLNAICLNQT